MEDRKYELVMDDSIIIGDSITLYRIKALRDFNDIKAGELGGYVMSYYNLSHEGECWIYVNAKVYEKARVFGNAEVYENAKVCGYARLYDNAQVCGYAEVYGDTKVCDNALICSNAHISSDNDYLYIKGLGSQNRSTTAFRLSDGGVYVNCGCFSGTLSEFESKVNDTHGDTIYGREYKALIYICKLHFGLI